MCFEQLLCKNLAKESDWNFFEQKRPGRNYETLFPLYEFYALPLEWATRSVS